MLFGPDGLANTFLFMFLFGLIFTTVSVLLGFVNAGAFHFGGNGGHIGDVGHAGHVGDVGHAGHIGDVGHAGHLGDVGHAGHVGHVGDIGHAGHAGDVGHAQVSHGADVQAATQDSGLGGPGILNMPTILAFVTWFGGVGYLLRTSLGLGALFAVPLAAVSGVVGGALMFTALVRVLWPMMSKPLDSADYRLPGTSARVVSPIRAGGVGEIVYTKGDSRFTCGARSSDGEPIAKGASVVILSYEHGIAQVQDIEKLLKEQEQEAQEQTSDVESGTVG